MLSRVHKLLFVFVFVTLLLSTFTIIFAAQGTPTVKRISGDNRYATSSAVALSKWTQSDYAILAYGQDFPDALSAAPLAKKYNAPILLTETNFIPKETLNAIQQLQIKTTIIVGGTGIISSVVEQQLTSLGITVKRIFGQDRYETGIKIAEQLDNVNEIAIVTGESFSDALSISPIAVKKNMPIILIQHNAIPAVVSDYINSHKLTKTYVIGSGTSLNNAILTGLSNIELITGNDKYQINLNIIDKFKSDLDLSAIYIATGENFADALSGSILAGSNSNPLMLIGKDSSDERSYFIDSFKDLSNIYILGGTGAISDNLINELISSSTASINLSASTKIKKIEFPSTDLPKSGTNTATFKYRVIGEDSTDITKTVSASMIDAYASVPSSVSLDPSTGTGTIKYDYSFESRIPIFITLVDKANGIPFAFKSGVSEPKDYDTSKLYPIGITSDKLTKTGTNTATFEYKVFGQDGIKDITKLVPASDIIVSSHVGPWATLDDDTSPNAMVTLDPLTETATVTYKFSDNDTGAAISMKWKKNGMLMLESKLGIGVSYRSVNSNVNEINIISDSLTKTESNKGTFQYKILDNNGVDITNTVPASDLTATALVGTSNASISLDPLTHTGIVTYNFSDTDKSIVVQLMYSNGVIGTSILSIVTK